MRAVLSMQYVFSMRSITAFSSTAQMGQTLTPVIAAAVPFITLKYKKKRNK